MSIEFSAKLENLLEESVRSSIVASLRTDARYRLVRTAAQEVGLAQTTDPSVPKDMELITVYFKDKAVDVAFHQGTRVARTEFLKSFQNLLAQKGFLSEFEEL